VAHVHELGKDDEVVGDVDRHDEERWLDIVHDVEDLENGSDALSQ
jgi:hypothetical protein